MIRFLILAGYFELTMYLQLSGKLNQYINLHYSYLAYISMFLSFVLALVQLIIWVKQMKIHSHLSGFWAKVASIFLLCIPLFVGLFFPTVTLDSQTQYLKPDTSSYFTKSAYESEMKQAAKKYVDKKVIQVTTENYMEVMEVIYDYPDQFAGKTIELTGFVYNDPNNKDSQFLFRFGIIHCIADSGVYGLLTTGAPQHFENNTWIQAKGTLSIEYHKQLKQSLPVLHIRDCQTITKPDNPYVYRVF